MARPKSPRFHCFDRFLVQAQTQTGADANEVSPAVGVDHNFQYDLSLQLRLPRLF